MSYDTSIKSRTEVRLSLLIMAISKSPVKLYIGEKLYSDGTVEYRTNSGPGSGTEMHKGMDDGAFVIRTSTVVALFEKLIFFQKADVESIEVISGDEESHIEIHLKDNSYKDCTVEEGER